MASNYLQPGETLKLTAPYQCNAGKGAQIGQVFGVAQATVANAAVGEFMIKGVHTLDKVSAQAWTEGALIYWDNAAKLCTTVNTSNLRIGFAAAAAANPTSTGAVCLHGMAAPAGA